MELDLEWKLGDPSKRLNARSMAADRTVASCATEYGVLVVVKLELGLSVDYYCRRSPRLRTNAADKAPAKRNASHGQGRLIRSSISARLRLDEAQPRTASKRRGDADCASKRSLPNKIIETGRDVTLTTRPPRDRLVLGRTIHGTDQAGV